MYRGGDYDDAVDIVDIWLKEDRPAEYYEPAATVVGLQIEFESTEWVDELLDEPMPR